jgi:hypothetical protein
METTEKAVMVWGIEHCDSCKVRAKYFAYKEDLLLTFCGHHMARNIDVLMESGWEVDECN